LTKYKKYDIIKENNRRIIIMDSFNASVEKLKNNIQEQIKEAYLQGSDVGSVTTCAIIYKTMSDMGLEKTNFLFSMLRDIAAAHKCDNLEETVKEMFEKEESKNSF
jgi:predicted phage-related endonuclease